MLKYSRCLTQGRPEDANELSDTSESTHMEVMNILEEYAQAKSPLDFFFKLQIKIKSKNM